MFTRSSWVGASKTRITAERLVVWPALSVTVRVTVLEPLVV